MVKHQNKRYAADAFLDPYEPFHKICFNLKSDVFSFENFFFREAIFKKRPKFFGYFGYK